jgi:hypothetical protein
MIAFYDHIVQQLEAIEDCLQKRRTISGLCLLYTAIDVVASLERKPEEGTRASFTRWVDENMQDTHPLPCTALELYAARCGVLHTFTPDSDLSRNGKVRMIAYAWGNASAGDLQEAGQRLGRTEVAVHVSDLVASFRAGLVSYLDHVIHIPDRLAKIDAHSSLWFTPLNQQPVKQFLDLSSRSEKNG